MKALRWIVLVAIAATAAAVYWYFNPDHRPGVLAEHLPVSPESETHLYRWRDDAGNWVVSDEPPDDGRPFERVGVRQDTNVVPAYDPTED